MAAPQCGHAMRILLILTLSIWLLTALIQIPTARAAPSDSDSSNDDDGDGDGDDQRSGTEHEYDVIIYGNTVAAISAAIQVKRLNVSTAIIFPGNVLGGLTTSGLGWTDSKDGKTVGGIAREFYSRIYQYYQIDDTWKYGTREEYINKGIWAQPGWAIDTTAKVQWTFEPHAAELVLESWVQSENIPVYRNQSIDREADSVVKNGTIIKSFSTLEGHTFKGKMFIDAGYEGDLMEKANITYRVGRESREQYDESAAGVLVLDEDRLANIDAWHGKSRSGSGTGGLIPGIQRIIANPEKVQGTADPIRLQSYNYRLCLTREVSNRVKFTKPEGYNETDYLILFRYIDSGYDGPFFTRQEMPNYKTDSNAAGQVSTDLIGGNYDDESNYADYSYEKRKESAIAHKKWAQGFLWTLAYHERVPEKIRNYVSEFGYAADEWPANDNFPHELYIREGRRMMGVYTMTQKDIQDPQTYSNDSVVGNGYYTLDVHIVGRVVVDDRVRDEGLVHVPNKGPFAVPYGSILPLADDATNFLNPVTMSASHVALSAIRMEPMYMILGQSAGTAAVLAMQAGVDVQDVDRDNLTAVLNGHDQVLDESSGMAWGMSWSLLIGVGMVYLFM